MRQYKYYSAFVAIAVLALFGIVYLGPGDDALERREVRNIVVEFGSQLQNVPLVVEEEALKAAIETNYAPYVTDQLLEVWLRAPTSAPGRETSSPWPARIDVSAVSAQGESYVVNGRVVLMTSEEVASPGDDNAGEVPVVALLVETEAGWRIAAYEEQAPQ